MANIQAQPKYLVTGASGFVGYHLARRLSRDGDGTVVALVRPTSHVSHLQAQNIKMVTGDLLDRPSLNYALEGVTKVFHCAALTTDWARPREYQATNVAGVANLVEAAHQAGVERFIHLSSCEVYGNPGQPDVIEGSPLVFGQHPYTDSKIQGEKIVWQHSDAGLPAVILRPATIYGPYSRTLIGGIVSLLHKNKMMFVNEGQAIARLCYIDNLTKAILLAAENNRALGQVYNISDGCSTSWEEFINKLATLLGYQPVQKSLSYAFAMTAASVSEFAAKLVGQEHRPLLTRMVVRMMGTNQSFSIEKIKQELSFEPTVSFLKGITETAAWAGQELTFSPETGPLAIRI